jgi:hypothetical protein
MSQSEFESRMPLYGTISLVIAAIAFTVYFTTPSVATISLLAGTIFFLMGFACLGAWAWKRSLAKNKE